LADWHVHQSYKLGDLGDNKSVGFKTSLAVRNDLLAERSPRQAMAMCTE